MAKYAERDRGHCASRTGPAVRSSRSPTTAWAAPTRPAAQACAGWPTASPRWTAACRRSPPARGPSSRRRCRARSHRRRLCPRPRRHRRASTARVRRGGAEAGPDELLLAIDGHMPDVAIVDVRMPPSRTDEGLRAAERIRERHPGSASSSCPTTSSPGSRRGSWRDPRAPRLSAQGPRGRPRWLRRCDPPCRRRRLGVDPAVVSGLFGARARTPLRPSPIASARSSSCCRGPVQPGYRRGAGHLITHCGGPRRASSRNSGSGHGHDHRRVLAVLEFLRA